MKHNTYEIEKNIEKLQSGNPTGFLLQNVQKDIKMRIKKNNFYEWVPYDDAEKVIFYTDIEPKVSLFRIDSYHELKHASILGSLLALNITNEMFGHIVYYQEHFYLYILNSIKEYIQNEFTLVGKDSISLIEMPIDYLKDFHRNYEEIKLIVSSLRVDTILARIIHSNRNHVRDLILQKQIIINYDVVKRNDYIMKEMDIFSVRGYGKYRFHSIVGNTKKENYVILVQKYL